MVFYIVFVFFFYSTMSAINRGEKFITPLIKVNDLYLIKITGSNLIVDIVSGDVSRVIGLLDNGTDVNIKNEHGSTPLFTASKNGSTWLSTVVLSSEKYKKIKWFEFSSRST